MSYDILVARIKELEATEERFNTFMAAIVALGPHAGKPDAHVEALLDKVKRVGELEAEVKRLRGLCKRAEDGLRDRQAVMSPTQSAYRNLTALIDDLANEWSNGNG